MSKTAYRRKAILSRIHKALNAFYLLQKIDWEYDIGESLRKILGLALEEIELDGEKVIERALIIVKNPEGENLEIKAGWKTRDADLSFSHTVVQETFERGEAILCENAKDDPRFMNAESLKQLETLSLVAVPMHSENQPVGVFYVESESAGNVFNSDDLEFLQEFAQTITPFVKFGITHQGHVREIRKLKEEAIGRYDMGNIIGRSEAITGVFELVRIAAEVDRTVLITGESGSGKELIANAIHHNGPRKAAPFIVVDCSGLSEHLLESELFGHLKGAFTGANNEKMGAFEEADGGTIFLDEIKDSSRSLQQKLRRVLQEGELRRVGENKSRKVDVRVICATNEDLAKRVQSGDFIQDLYYRINKFPIHIPALEERREDIPLLVAHFLRLMDQAEPRESSTEVTPETMDILVHHDWSENNIRQLRNTVELARDLAEGELIDLPVLDRVFRIQCGENPESLYHRPPGDLGMPTGHLVNIHSERFKNLLEKEPEVEENGKRNRPDTPFYRLQSEFQARVITEGLRSCKWKIRPAARLLGISPMKLRTSLKDYLGILLARPGMSLETAAGELDIPPEIIEKKAKDFGLEDRGKRR